MAGVCPKCNHECPEGVLLCGNCGEPLGSAPEPCFLVCFPYPPVSLDPAKIVTIGRSRYNDIVLPFKIVSRKHAQVRWNGSEYIIRDTQSSNGTFVEGGRVTSWALKNGDQIRVGSFAITFEVGTPGDQPSAGDADVTMMMGDMDAVDLSKPPPQTTGREAEVLKGDLSKMGLCEILQFLEMNQRTGTLEVTQNARPIGTIYVSNGDVVNASAGDARAEAAVRVLIPLQEGKFDILEGEPSCERAIQRKTTALLLDLMRQVDEAAP